MCSYVRSTKGERQNFKIGTSVPTFMNSYINPWQADQYAGFSYFRTHYNAPFMAGAKDLLNNPVFKDYNIEIEFNIGYRQFLVE